MAKKAVNHVALHDQDVACFHCGARVQVVPPGMAPIMVVMAAARAFEKIHQNCRETPDSPTKKLETNPGEWERGLFVGSSSATIFAVMMGRAPVGMSRDRIGATLCDPGDFSRCHRLLRVMPEWRGRLKEVAEKHPAWKAMVENWERLEAMFEKREPGMYEFMNTLRP